jgi:transglutaminase-like putative cysteine protease
MSNFRNRRLRGLFTVFAGLLAGASVAVAAPAADFTVSAPPAWVEAIAPDLAASAPTEQLSAGVHYLLSDTQTRVDAQDRTTWRHLAMKAVNQSGVESVAHVQIGFDPAWQVLSLHSIRLHRDGRVISKLNAAAVKVLQQEKELEYRIFDGSKTAHVFLEDVRVGDVVEYAYSVRGSNPVFGNRQFGRIELQWNVPVHQLVARLAWPVARKLALKPLHTALQPVITEHDGLVDHRWEARDVAPLVVESGAPEEFNPYPIVQWSEFADWGAVARWAEPLYRRPAVLGPALRAEVDRIAADGGSAAYKAAQVLRFVQGEIRYLGVEVGPGSHAPSAPDTVLERRFGDCKDKSLLTVTMLHALGIEARPALVHTSSRGTIADLQPTPGAFNHVVVRAEVDGTTYWLDPTRSPQPGTLDSLVQAGFGRALVVGAGATGLAEMPPAPQQHREVRMLIDASAGLDQPVRLTVVTVTNGSYAESLRDSLATTNRDDLQKNYLNFYARYYPDITVSSPITVADDGHANRVTVTESYRITAFWTRNEDRKRLESAVFAPDMEDALRAPRQTRRDAPLALGLPTEFVHTVEVRLPGEWPIEAEHTEVKDPAFSFEHSVGAQADRRVVTLRDRLVSHVDQVAGADAQRYAGNLERARGNLGYNFYKNDAGAAPAAAAGTGFNWLVAFLGAMFAGLWCMLAWKLYRWDPLPRAPVQDPSLAGLRSWLVLVGLSLVFAPVRLVYDIGSTLPSYSLQTWNALTVAGQSAYDPMWAPVMLIELAINLAKLIFVVMIAVLFFRRRSSLPALLIGWMVITPLVHAADLVVAARLLKTDDAASARDWAEVGRSVFFSLVWTLYFVRSERVAATFTRRLRTELRPAPAEDAGAPVSAPVSAEISAEISAETRPSPS